MLSSNITPYKTESIILPKAPAKIKAIAVIKNLDFSFSTESHSQYPMPPTAKILNKVKNNLPSQKESNIMHVRPHAQDRDDVYELPDGQYLTKQCFWLNREYIMQVISNDGKNNE